MGRSTPNRYRNWRSTAQPGREANRPENRCLYEHPPENERAGERRNWDREATKAERYKQKESHLPDRTARQEA